MKARQEKKKSVLLTIRTNMNNRDLKADINQQVTLIPDTDLEGSNYIIVDQIPINVINVPYYMHPLHDFVMI